MDGPLWDLAPENLVNIQGSYAILDEYFTDVRHTLNMAL